MILHRYISRLLWRNLGIALLGSTVLFLLVDSFERLDDLLAHGAKASSAFWYFIYKIPLTLNLMLPVSMLVATLFTIGLLSKQSEITAMRAAGLPLRWIARPVLSTAFIVSIGSLILNETLVPHATRRVYEIYNLDIKQKDRSGRLSQTDLWWRRKDTFYSAEIFDSRTNALHGMLQLQMSPNFEVARRVDAASVRWLNPLLGWSMRDVNEYELQNQKMTIHTFRELPLPIADKPEDFYELRMDPQALSFRAFRKYLKKLAESGVDVSGDRADLQAKLAFPFVVLVVTFVSWPFALKPARSGTLALSFVAGIAIGFTYYAVHSFSLALGRSELWPPVVAAWMANVVMGAVGFVLNSGAESPT